MKKREINKLVKELIRNRDSIETLIESLYDHCTEAETYAYEKPETWPNSKAGKVYCERLECILDTVEEFSDISSDFIAEIDEVIVNFEDLK